MKKTRTITLFQKKVYAALERIPRGKVTTYLSLAKAVGCRSPRAIGQALRANPFAPEVPCHRVIASNLTPGGYNGHSSGAPLKRKLRRLAVEGVLFENNRLAEPQRLLILK